MDKVAFDANEIQQVCPLQSFGEKTKKDYNYSNKYKVNRREKMEKFYEQLKPINTLETRAYYIPFARKTEVFNNRRENDRYFSLNGKWKIKEYQSPMDLADDFYLSSPKTEIEVPSCVQLNGFDHIQYTNLNYPFPYNPPFVPNLNPTYHYQRTFNFVKSLGKQYINFEGVDSCFYL